MQDAHWLDGYNILASTGNYQIFSLDVRSPELQNLYTGDSVPRKLAIAPNNPNSIAIGN